MCAEMCSWRGRRWFVWGEHNAGHKRSTAERKVSISTWLWAYYRVREEADMCVLVLALRVWAGRGREKDTQRCIKRTHPFTVMISSHYQQPELVANQSELFCSESTSRQLTNDCFLYAETNTNSAQSDLISYPFCHSCHWLAPVLSTRTSLLSIPPAFISIAVSPCCFPFVHSTQLVLFLCS